MKTQALDDAIDHALAERRIVGTIVSVIVDGELVYRRAAGLADREANTPMRENAIFRYSSLTKPIVTTTAIALVEQGRMKLDDPVTRWLPDFKPKTADGQVPTITLRQLITHTAGLTYGFNQPESGSYHQERVSDGLDQPGLSMDEELRRIVKAGLVAEPGQQWHYSVGIDVIGAVVAKVTGETLQDAVKRLVTGPLHMSDTVFSVTDVSRLATPYADGTTEPVRMADPHVVPFGGLAGIRFSPSRALDPTSFPSGGCGMTGTANDFTTFLETIRRGGEPVLKPESARAMLSNQCGALGPGPGWGFGFGGQVLMDPSAAQTPQSVGTWVWGGVYGHTWFVDPARKVVVTSLTNTAIEGLFGKFTIDVRDAVYAGLA